MGSIGVLLVFVGIILVAIMVPDLSSKKTSAIYKVGVYSRRQEDAKKAHLEKTGIKEFDKGGFYGSEEHKKLKHDIKESNKDFKSLGSQIIFILLLGIVFLISGTAIIASAFN